MSILLLALFFAVGYLIYSFTTRKRLRIGISVPASQNPYEIWIQRLVILGAILLLLFGLSYYTGKSSFCANCHSDKKEAKALNKSPHKGIQCLQCHQPAGISGAVLQKIDYSRWLWVYAVTNTVMPQRAHIDDGACLRCHNDVRRSTVSRYSIKVRHKDFLEKGARCIDCHNAIAHPEVTKPEHEPSMGSCIKCHNDRVAKADCSVCHEKDIGSEIRGGRRGVMKVGVSPNWDFCYRCHDEEGCTACHGIKMPHPPNWLSRNEVKHALPGFTKREICWRCHDIPSAPLQPAMMQSCGCHGTMMFHGPREKWRKDHGPIAIGNREGDGENDYCYNCHSEKLCDHCHTEGRYKARQQPGDGGLGY
ncbi:MAG: NapC/NirT family cytochrome c [Actinobacteria bacterium]|nr:NapC/NirT family cytochrome c [Actinomycetota bacterium]